MPFDSESVPGSYPNLGLRSRLNQRVSSRSARMEPSYRPDAVYPVFLIMEAMIEMEIRREVREEANSKIFSY